MATMTDLFGRVVLAMAVIAMLFAAAGAAFGEPHVVSGFTPSPGYGGPAEALRAQAGSRTDVTTPAQAIARAVAQRVGGGVAVDVISLETTVAPERALRALPEPGGRAGEPVRFVLMAGRVRRGVAVATVKVVGSYARAVRAIARQERVAPDAVEIVEGELLVAGFKRLPAGSEVIGLVARRDIAAGEPLTQTVLLMPPLVRSGDAVALTVIAGTVRVTAKAVAAASGHEGDVIRVVPEGGKPLKARITGRGSVEVVQ